MLGGVYLVGVLTLTLVALPWQATTGGLGAGVLAPGTWLDPATWTTGTSSEFIANVLLFVPLGALFARGAEKTPAVVLITAAAVLSLLIEVAQLQSDRISDPRDLIANTAGAIIGVVAIRFARRLTPALEPRRTGRPYAP